MSLQRKGFTPLDSKHLTGFSLIEILASVLIISVALGACLLLIGTAFRLSGEVRNEIIASHLTQEGIEAVRNIRESNWVQDQPAGWVRGLQNITAGEECTPDYPIACPFSGNVNWNSDELVNIRQGRTPSENYDGIYFDPGTSRYSHNPSANPTPFFRRIEIDFIEDSEVPGRKYMELKSIVTWQERGKTKKIEVFDRLYNWR